MISQHLGKEGQGYLVELTRSKNIRIVNSAVEALGTFSPDADAKTRLKELAAGSPNEALREHALRSLLLQSVDPALADQAWGLKAFDDGFRVMAIEWWAKHNPDRAREVCLSVLAGNEDYPVRIAACQALGVVKEAPEGHPVFDALIRVATENSYRPRTTAIRALGSLGNPGAIPVLKSISPYAPGGVIGSANASIKKLEGSN
jgi:hypothetical protein